MPDTIALLFGMAIILVFSYDRFNVATYDGEARLDRLVTLISPDKLRARSTVLKAYSLYAGMLIVIYLFLCAYAEILPILGGPNLLAEAGTSQLPVEAGEVPLADASGFVSVGDAAEAWAQPLAEPEMSSRGIGIAPSVSLGMALVIVGLAPTFPFLKRFDEWMRGAAHRLAGIPTWVLEAGDALRRERILGETTIGSAPLISKDDRERFDKLKQVAKGSRLKDDADFWKDLVTIFVVSNWIVEDKVRLSRPNSRLIRLEKTLSDRTEALFQQIDGIIAGGGFAPIGGPEPTPTANGDNKNKDSEVAGNRRPSTAPIARRVDDLAADFRILVALYVEHGVIKFDTTTDVPANDATRTNQYDRAMAMLREYAEAARDEPSAANDTNYATSAWLWTLGVTLVFAVIWSATFGWYETILQRGGSRSLAWRAATYAFLNFNVYGVTLLIALVVRDGFRHQTTKWHDSLRLSDWTRWLPQRFFAALAAWLGATFFLIGVTLWTTAARDGWTFSGSIASSFEYNAPTALRGSVMAIIVLALVDRRQIGARAAECRWKDRFKQLLYRIFQKQAPQSNSTRVWSDRRREVCSSLRWAGGAAGLMAVAGLVTRALTTIAADYKLSEFDGEISALVIYAALQSALVGFCVAFCVSEMLFLRIRSAAPRSSGPGQAKGGDLSLEANQAESPADGEPQGGGAGAMISAVLMVLGSMAGAIPASAAMPESVSEKGASPG